MRKKHWLKITLITLAVCAAAGLILAVILWNASPGRTGVSSSIDFSFEGAAEGMAPNGYRFDLSGLQSDEVLEAALKNAGVEGTYTADQIRSSMIIAGVYPKDIVEQMTGYQSLLTGDAGKISAGDYHATLYSVTLYNDFDKSISRENLEKILEAVMTEFRAYFEKTYAMFMAKDSMLENLSDYDYPQQLEVLGGAVSRNREYADEMAEKHPDFMISREGFADIAARYENLESTDLERLNGLVTMNALAKNTDRIVAQYENQITVLKIRLQELQTEAQNVDTLVDQYNKDGIIYVSTSGALQKVGSTSAATYDALVTRKQEIADSIADLNKELAQVQLKLSDIIGAEAAEIIAALTETETGDAADAALAETAATAETAETATAETAAALTEEEREAQKAVVEKGIAAALNKYNKITEDFSAFLKAYSEREMNDSTVAITPVKYSTPKLLSGAFAKSAVKVAGPICVLGLLVCILIMVVSQWRAKRKAKA